MVENIQLVIVSFFASFGFGIVFHIEKKHLFWAGLGGGLTRCVYLILLHTMDNRLMYSILAAMFAALYAEIMATYKKTPSTLFLYPSIIPLIPGDLLYNTMRGVILQDIDMIASNAQSCCLTLIGMSAGFVIVSTITYYKRIYFVGKQFVEDWLSPSHWIQKRFKKSKQ